jgi:hypothetical protein
MLIIKILNDRSGTDESANYNYGVYVNERRIANGRVEGHNRNDGWDVLVRRICNPDKPEKE